MEQTILVTIMSILVLAILSVCPAGPSRKAEKDADTDAAAAKRDVAKKVVKSGNAFAADLYAQLASKDKGNLFFSPVSIQTALAMTYAGARGNTEKQMYACLKFPKRWVWGKGTDENSKPDSWVADTWPQDRLHPAFAALIKDLNTPRLDPNEKPVYELVVANALWGQKGYPFHGAFIKLVKDSYGAGLNEMDFHKSEEARQKINKWVEKQTKEKIKDLIGRGVINDLTRLILTNAIYFKSNWAEKFQKSATQDGEFTLSDGKTVTAPMMHQRESYGYMETDAFQAVDLPYMYNDLSMIVLLPKKTDGLAAMEKTLTAENLGKWLGPFSREDVILTLPKFKFTSKFSLGKTLKAMGMTDAFNGDAADFSGMTTMEKLFISAVIHKAFVAVDEEGTEAAAATAVDMVGAGMLTKPKEPKVFKADHPFVFMIRHLKTDSVLFMGRVANPKG